MPAIDVPLVPAYGIFHRGIHRCLPVVATVDPGALAGREWSGVMAALHDAGATVVRVEVPWGRHAPDPTTTCLDGSDGRSPDVEAALRAAVVEGLDVWVAAGPLCGGVPAWLPNMIPEAHTREAGGRPSPRWACGHPAFLMAASAWETSVATMAASVTGGHVAFWEVDGVPSGGRPHADWSPGTVARFQGWLRVRHGDDGALARDWLRPGLRLEDASPPDLPGEPLGPWRRLGALVARLHQHWRDVRVPIDPWPGAGVRRGPRSALPVALAGRSPAQLADWHEFMADEWQAYLSGVRDAVAPLVPGATFVAGEPAHAGRAGIGHAGGAWREATGREFVPVATIAPRVHDAAWAATALSARAGAGWPVIVAVRPEPGGGLPATIVAAIGDGAVAVAVPAGALEDPDLSRLAAWIGRTADSLTASTRLGDAVAWLDEPGHAGADPDDLDPLATGVANWRPGEGAAFGAVREAGVVPMVVDAEALVPDAARDLVCLVVPTRRWIDLDRYGSLVVHALRGGNLVAIPHAPGRQRDGTPFRSTFLWPADVRTGRRVQVHDGTSALEPNPAAIGHDGARPDWIARIVEDAAPRLRPSRGLQVSATMRLMPGGDCLAFIANPIDRPQSGILGVADPAALGISDTFVVEVAFATRGARAGREGMGIAVVVPASGALIVGLSG